MRNYFNKTSEAAPLALFRILFGVLMAVSLVRFWLKGWIETLYIEPKFHFSYYGFEWVKPLGIYTYIIFIVCFIASLAVAFGYKYRLAIITFFLSFTYIELMDKTTYLNHYYFISLVGFILIFLPANAYFSVDAKQNKRLAYQKVPQWTIDAIKLMLGIVYFYAGLAKLNSDWLLEATPLKIWLAAKYNMPVIGFLMSKTWFHYAMSWSGALYDLLIPFLLLNRKTRPLAFFMVVVFHVFTSILFPIGMFPYIMIFATLIFFNPSFHHSVLDFISKIFGIKKSYFDNRKRFPQGSYHSLKITILTVFFIVQILFPWRYLLYPGELFWTEEGYRFSWRVMLMEKAGFNQFKVVDESTGKTYYPVNEEYLTPFQKKQMSFQPDFILEYAHFLGKIYKEKGIENPKVYVDSYVTLNGRISVPFIDPKVDLLKEKDSFKHKTFILPFQGKIKGL